MTRPHPFPLRTLWFLLFAALWSPSAVPADDAGKTDEAVASTEKPAREEFQQVLANWKTLLKEIRDVRAQFLHVAEDAKLDDLRERFQELKAEGIAMEPALRKAALAAFEESPNEDRELTRFLVGMAVDSNRFDDYEVAWQISNSLITSDCEDRRIYEQAGMAAFALHRFEEADKFLKEAQRLGSLENEEAQKYIQVAEDYQQYWEEEQRIRAKEAEAGDLPRVKFVTSKGDIVLELFENEAPETVGNFVHLVKSGFYSDKVFHRVIPQFVAQGGCPKGDGSGGPGYDIFCECRKPDHRKHFSGVISMAHHGLNTGGSQFFLTFVPTAHLNGKHTVFGRIVEGMDVLRKLQRIDPEAKKLVAPDKIISAEVMNLRDHPYVPNKVPRR